MRVIVLTIAALLYAAAAHAQTYPSRPVKVIAPFAPGGPVDVVARVLAPKLSENLGQQLYVENHPGRQAATSAPRWWRRRRLTATPSW